jgi:N-acetylmuramoyl-L-alanine amidase
MPLDAAMALIDRRDAWGAYPPINIPRHPAEKHLKDVTIVLDPGHGASDGIPVEKDPKYKRGPTGVREDDVNLRVGLLLARLLRDAGANVILTREADVQLGLNERSEIANTAPRPDGGRGADLFISIHHNAVNNPTANYTSVWYHGEVDDAEVALDAGRYIAHRLGAAMRTDVARTSPLLSDQLMYGGGFGVLRGCDVPGILLECSFFSNPDEEQRLRDAGYNLRTAYAIYEGLCEWAYGGRPTQSTPFISEPRYTETPGGAVYDLVVSTTLSDGLPAWWGRDRNRILSSTVSVTVEGHPELSPQVEFDPASKAVTARLSLPAEKLRDGHFVLRVQFANMFKHHNHPQRFAVQFARSAEGAVMATVTPLRVKQAVPPAIRPTTQ